MLTPMPHSPSIESLLVPFRNLFSCAEFSYLQCHLQGVLSARPSPALSAAARHDPQQRHYTCHRDFLQHCKVDIKMLKSLRFNMIFENMPCLTTLPDGRQGLVLANDDTLHRRPFARSLPGLFVHHDHSAKSHQASFVKGQCEVLLGLIPQALQPDGARALLLDQQLYVPLDAALKDSSQEHPDFDNKMALAALMLRQFRLHVPESITLYTLVDRWYAKVPFFKEVLDHVPNAHVIGRLMTSRVLHLPAPVVHEKKRGRPRIYGERWDWQEELEEQTQTQAIELYGQAMQARWVSKSVILRGWPVLVRVVCAQLLSRRGEWGKPCVVMSTDATLDEQTILRLYSTRFALEETIKDCRATSCYGQERVRHSRSVKLSQELSLLGGNVLRIYGETATEEELKRIREPWSRNRQARLTMGEVRDALWYESWSGERIFGERRRGEGLAKMDSG